MSQAVRVDGNGAFHDVWSPNEPNTARIDGTLTPTTFSATLTCLSTAATGALSATWDGSAFVGTITLGGQTHALRVALGGSPNGFTLTR